MLDTLLLMDFRMLVAFLAATFMLMATPAPGAIFRVASGLMGAPRAGAAAGVNVQSCPAAIGVTVAIKAAHLSGRSPRASGVLNKPAALAIAASPLVFLHSEGVVRG